MTDANHDGAKFFIKVDFSLPLVDDMYNSLSGIFLCENIVWQSLFVTDALAIDSGQVYQ